MSTAETLHLEFTLTQYLHRQETRRALQELIGKAGNMGDTAASTLMSGFLNCFSKKVWDLLVSNVKTQFCVQTLVVLELISNSVLISDFK